MIEEIETRPQLQQPRWIDVGHYTIAVDSVRFICWRLDEAPPTVYIDCGQRNINLTGKDAEAFRTAWTQLTKAPSIGDMPLQPNLWAKKAEAVHE